jgi:hypothetical protein
MHYFTNTGNVDAKFLVVVTPAGLDKFFHEAFSPAGHHSAPPPVTEAMFGRILEAAPRPGLEFAPTALH